MPPMAEPAVLITGDAEGTLADAKLIRTAVLENAVEGGNPAAHQDTQRTLENAVRADFVAQSLILDALSFGDSDVWVYYENNHYARDSEAAGRIVRILMARAPPAVEYFHLISVKHGMPQLEARIARSTLERAIIAHSGSGEVADAVRLSAPPLDNPVLEEAQRSLYPRFNWSVGPSLHAHFPDQDSSLQVQLQAAVNATLEIAPGWALETRATANIYNDYKYPSVPDTVLPHVRSDETEYIKHGAYGFSYLRGVYRARLAEDLFVEAKAGYLEDMYMGAGGQILWRPDGDRFAIGADLYQVWKRDFNRLFGAQDYTVLTGHVSLYYQSPWHGLNFALHAGRYLARDKGITLEITRRFASGVEIGGYVTVTNVPSNKIGQSNLDKGVIIRIPLEWALPIFSQSSFDYAMHSATHDCGQRLTDDDSLYDETRKAGNDEFTEHLGELVEP